MNECFVCKSVYHIEDSHDIPKYIGGEDKDGRRFLCKKHHQKYDKFLLIKILESINEYPQLNDWLDIKEWQCEMKKYTYLHASFQQIVKNIIPLYFNQDADFDCDEKYYCVECKLEIDIEEKLNNSCDKCFTPQNKKCDIDNGKYT